MSSKSKREHQWRVSPCQRSQDARERTVIVVQVAEEVKVAQDIRVLVDVLFQAQLEDLERDLASRARRVAIEFQQRYSNTPLSIGASLKQIALPKRTR
jgi:hypothetical protein